MGQAKRRGTFEDRQAQAIARDAELNKTFNDAHENTKSIVRGAKLDKPRTFFDKRMLAAILSIAHFPR